VRLARDLGARRTALSQVAARDAKPVGFAGQVVRFAAIGVLSTLAYAALYLAFRAFASGQLANAAALLVTAIGNTAANRRYTFAIRDRLGRGRHQLQGLAVFGLALVLTAGALAALTHADPHASRPVELVVLIGANLLATVLRFVLLRSWVFRSRRAAPAGVPS